MAGLELVLLLLAVSAGLRLVAERLTIPYAAILVVGGLLLALVPGLPRVTLAPEVLFLVFVPPLLYWGAVSFPLRDVRREVGPIVRLAVLLVLVSTAAVAAVAHALDPAFTWAAAIALGAIVSPPDPVAVLSIMRSIRLPHAVASILEGEGLFNDATALVIYRLAVTAAVTGAFSPGRAALEFLIDGAGGIAIGLVVGVAVVKVYRLTRAIPVVSITVSLLTPFASYLLADLLGASGVLSVVATGLYTARAAPRVVGPAIRIQFSATWTVVTFMLESLVFILVGLELRYVTRALEHLALTTLLRQALLVSVCVILARLLWVMPSAFLFRSLGRWIRGSDEPLPSWRAVLFTAWAGLRGGDSLVLALSLPLQTATGARFPARDQVVFITFSVILITLVLQGPTLAPFAKRLGIGIAEWESREEAHARLAVAEAGLRALKEPAMTQSPHPEVVRYLQQRHAQRARRWAAREGKPREGESEEMLHDHFVVAPSHDAAVVDDRRAQAYRRARSAMLDAEHKEVLLLRDRGEIGDDVMRRIQRDLDLESLLLDSSEPVSETVSEVPAAIDARSR